MTVCLCDGLGRWIAPSSWKSVNDDVFWCHSICLGNSWWTQLQDVIVDKDAGEWRWKIPKKMEEWSGNWRVMLDNKWVSVTVKITMKFFGNCVLLLLASVRIVWREIHHPLRQHVSAVIPMPFCHYWKVKCSIELYNIFYGDMILRLFKDDIIMMPMCYDNLMVSPKRMIYIMATNIH